MTEHERKALAQDILEGLRQDNTDIKKVIQTEVAQAFDAKLGQFYIDRETHWKDHEYVQGIRKLSDKVTGQACEVVTKSVVVGFAILLFWGFEGWIKKGISSIFPFLFK